MSALLTGSELALVSAGRKATKYTLEEIGEFQIAIEEGEEYVRERLVPGAVLLRNPGNATMAHFVVLTTEHSPTPGRLSRYSPSCLAIGIGAVEVHRGESWVCFELASLNGGLCAFVPFLVYDSSERAAEATHAIVFESGGTAVATEPAIGAGRCRPFLTPDVSVSGHLIVPPLPPRGRSAEESGKAFRCPQQLPELYPEARLIWDALLSQEAGDGVPYEARRYWPFISTQFRFWDIAQPRAPGLTDRIRNSSRPKYDSHFPLYNASLLPIVTVHERVLPWLVAKMACGERFSAELATASAGASRPPGRRVRERPTGRARAAPAAESPQLRGASPALAIVGGPANRA